MTHRTNTTTRNNIARYMVTFFNLYGRQPSFREIGRAVGITSTSTIAGYLQRMQKDGELGRSENRSRSYYVRPERRMYEDKNAM